MEAVKSPPTANCHILTNSPALHSLKRQQLVQLCKRNGIKATGKNAEIVEKLKAHALNHPLDSPHLDGRSFFSSDDEGNKENRRVAVPRHSEAWSVIEEDSREVERVHLGLKDIREEVEQEISNMSPMKGFGASSSGEFGNGTTSSKGSSMTSSLKAFAMSIKRGGSKMSTGPAPSIKLSMHTEEPSITDPLPPTSTPYRAHIQTYPPLPSPQPLDADDSRDQSLLDFGASTVRLVTTAPMGPSPPALRPFTPTFDPCYSPGSPSAPSFYPSLPVDEGSDPLPPGGFPDAINTPSKPPPPKTHNSTSQPFIFGSPAHQISNTQFNSAAASVLSEMNARLGLTGSSAVGLELLQNRGAPGQASISSGLQGSARTEVKSKFDRAHEREFEKMEGLGEWYARRNAASPGKSAPPDRSAGKKRKSDALEGAHKKPIGPSNARARRASRVVTPATRRSLVANAEAEEMDGRKTKRVRISAVEGGDKRVNIVDDSNKDPTAMDEDESKDKGETNEERERERAAIKKKLEISRARRRSSMGRVSVGGGKLPLIPNQPKKGTATRFGFLSSAKTLVKSVWNRGVGTSGPKISSTIPVSKPSQPTTVPVTKKSTANVLTKPCPPVNSVALKRPSVKASIGNLDVNTSLRVPSMGPELGRKSFTRTGSTKSSMGTRSSAASSVATRTSTASSASNIPAARRGPIPCFPVPTRTSRTNSLARAAGTLGSRASSGGTGSSRNTTGASSIGIKKTGFAFAPRPNDAGIGSTSSAIRKRTSTLFAPTASSLAKMQSTVRPPSLSRATSPPNTTGVEPKESMRVPESRTPVPGSVSEFTFTSPPQVDGAAAPNNPTTSIFSSGSPLFSPLRAPPSEAPPKPRALPQRRPRISRSRVIAKVGAQRAASGSSLARTPSGRRSLNAPKVRGSLGVRASGIGVKNNARDSAAMSARKKLRQSEILRRRSKVSGISPALIDREMTPDESREESTTQDEESRGNDGTSFDVSMEG